MLFWRKQGGKWAGSRHSTLAHCVFLSRKGDIGAFGFGALCVCNDTLSFTLSWPTQNSNTYINDC